MRGIDDGLRIYGADQQRARFHALCVAELERTGATVVTLAGSWTERRAAALAAIGRLR